MSKKDLKCQVDLFINTQDYDFIEGKTIENSSKKKDKRSFDVLQEFLSNNYKGFKPNIERKPKNIKSKIIEIDLLKQFLRKNIQKKV